jgi:acyl carrier protein
MSAADRDAVRAWILKTVPKLEPAQLTDDTKILKDRVITSLQIMDLILFIEARRKGSIDRTRMKPESFQSIRSICEAFFGGLDG